MATAAENLHSETVRSTWRGPLQTPETQPTSCDVVIIGGGIVGVSTAWNLARRGIRVVVCEKGFIAGEQSGRNWGWVRIQGRDPREVPMMLRSQEIWRGLAEDVGEDVGFAEGGCLYTARTEKKLAESEAWLPVAQEYGLTTRVIGREELATHVGTGAEQWVGALYTDTDGRAEPHKAAPAIARAARRAGTTILTGCAVRGLLTAAGRVSGVVTERGEIQARNVLCAAGAWSSMFCRSVGIDVPQLRVRGTVARTSAANSPIVGNVFDSTIGIRRRQDGGYTVAHGALLDHSITPATFRYAFKFLRALRKEMDVLKIRLNKDFVRELSTPTRWALDKSSPFERERVLDPKPDARAITFIKEHLGTTFPALADVDIVETWAGMVETTPDVVPVIDTAASIPGFHIATGFSGHGFGLGPGAGEAIAAMITGDATDIDLKPFRLARFYDGSPIVPQPGL